MICRNCKKNISNMDKICPYCNTVQVILRDKNGNIIQQEPKPAPMTFDEEHTEPVEDTVPEKKKKTPVLLATVIVLVAAGSFIAGGSLGKGQQESQEQRSYEPESDSAAAVRAAAVKEPESQIEDTKHAAIETTDTIDTIAEPETEFEPEPVYDSMEGGIHRYSYHVDDCTWSEAFRKAKEAGGYLVHINSYEEYGHILSQIVDQGYEKIQFRIGGRRNSAGEAYYWADDDNVLYGDMINGPDYWCSREWMQGEPSYRDGDIMEDCLDFYYYSKEGRWVWNDVPDDIIAAVPYYSGKIGYIVEYED